MNWCLPFEVKQFEERIRLGDPCLFIGSCFAQNMVHAGQQNGLTFLEAGFGTVFHPLAIERILSDALNERWTSFEQRCFESESGVFKSWDASSNFLADSMEDMQSMVVAMAKRLKTQLNTAKYLFVTFGSAWAYEKDQEVVANCHKQDQSLFTKSLSDLEQLTLRYESLVHLLKSNNPKLELVFTVSPVRHKRDGLVENNRSKARLLMLCELLETRGCNYFPAYEMVIDQLRDHRFYEADMVHPNQIAVNAVWEQFEDGLLSVEEKELRKEVAQINRMQGHQIRNRKEQAAWQLKIEKKKQVIEAKTASIFWT